MASYETLASLYDALQTKEDVARTKAVVSLLTDGEKKPLWGLDVGCGTGALTRALKSAGVIVTGIDASNAMLSVATKKAHGKIPYVNMRAERLNGFSDLDFITAVNDVVNYLPEKSVAEFFRRAYHALKAGGKLVFDVSSPYKLKTVLGKNLYGEDLENATYLWFNTPTDSGVKMELTFFLKNPDGSYRREDETHVEYAHEKKTIVSLLKKAGFINIRVFGEDRKPLKKNALRFCFAAEKRK